jgi:hypothetical protein
LIRMPATAVVSISLSPSLEGFYTQSRWEIAWSTSQAAAFCFLNDIWTAQSHQMMICDG